jgi:DNA-binding transcriptional MocR family regulator
MLKGQDVIVLLKLLGSAEPGPVRELADQLGFDVAGTHRAMRRLDEAGLYSAARRRIYPAAADEFLIHAAKFSFPPRWESEVRGVPTSWAAEPLKEELAVPESLPPVWPHSKGTVRGLGLVPLHAMAPKAALADNGLWQRLALVDALRSNDSARVTQLAAKLLKERIGS